jgi:hypothetical protein
MAWLSPTNIFWLLGHLIAVLLGILFLGTPNVFPWMPKAVAEGIGGGLIGSGIIGEILFLYVATSESTRARLEALLEAGLVKVFPSRSVRIRDEYEHRIKNAKEIDILGFGQSSFREDYQERFEQLSKQARLRVMLLDPDYPSRENSLADIRDREEGNASGQIRTDVELFESAVKKLVGSNRPNFKVRRLRAIPSVSIFRIDDVIFWGPYLVGQQSRNTPTLLVKRGGFLFAQLKQHFENIWSSDQHSTPMRQ